MQWYPWLTPFYRQFIEQHQKNRAHHARLMTALPGMGAEALVWGVSRWLMCQHPQGIKTCGRCHGCQLMQARHHPDWYQPQAEKGKQALGIDAVRKVSEKLWNFAQQGGARVIWINQAEKLTEAAANALLKTLEEPPENCWFFLTTSAPSTLPATLRSRCLVVSLTPPDEQYGLSWLAKQQAGGDPAGQRAALRLCSGAPGAALELITSARWQNRQALCQALAQYLPAQPLSLLSVLNQANVAENLHWLISLLMDGIKQYQSAGVGISNPDQSALVTHLTQLMPPRQLADMQQRWMQSRYILLTTPQVNPELLLTESLLYWEQQFLS